MPQRICRRNVTSILGVRQHPYSKQVHVDFHAPCLLYGCCLTSALIAKIFFVYYFFMRDGVANGSNLYFVLKVNGMNSAYEILKSDKELIYLLDNLNYNFNRMINFIEETSDINWNFACHGWHHALYVVDVVEYILSKLEYDNHIIELGKIAGLLHDVGVFFGKHNHAKISAAMCLNFISKTNLNRNDFRIIEQAILDHPRGNDIQSAVGAALLIADKIHDQERGIHVKEDLKKSGFNNEVELNKYDTPSSSFYINEFIFDIKDNNLIFSYLGKGDAEDFIKDGFSENHKPIMVTKKAAAYLNCNCIYKINEDVIKIFTP